MLNYPVGYRFAPTREESIKYYLKNKNLGKTSRVNDAISEINICNFKPEDLPALAKINSGDLVWYFFSPIVYANSKNTTMKRTTGSGFWKSTGKIQIIKDRSGSEIGIKRTVVYYEGSAAEKVKSHWVMHEYHITCLPPHQTTHVLCQVKYKGEDGHILYGASNSVVSHSNTVREINTVPEVDQPVEDGLNLNDLSIPLNVQENLCPQDAINPTLMQQTLEVQFNQPGQDGLSLNELSIPLNVQENLRPLGTIDPNTYLNYINPNLLQEIPEVQVEQPHQYHTFDPDTDILMDELIGPMDVQENHFPPPDEYDPDTFFNYADNENYGGNELLGYNEWNNEEFILQENRNVFMPRKALSGIIVDCSSDSDSDNDGDDAESICATSYNQETSSPHDSVGSFNEHFSRGSSTDSCKDLQTSADLSVNGKSWEHQLVPSKQELKENISRDKKTSMVETKKMDWFIQEETMERNHKLQYIYLMNMIISFIILVGLVGNIKY